MSGLEKSTLDVVYQPLMELPTLRLPYCAVCGRPFPLEQHHFVWRSWGNLVQLDGTKMEKPTVTLCGFGNNLMDADGRYFCHGMAHHRMLHFRNVNGRLCFLRLAEPTDYMRVLTEYPEWMWVPL